MYQLCALKYPYKSTNGYQIREEIMSDSPFPRIPEQYTDDLNNIIQLMLIRNVDKRPSVVELLNMEYFKRVWNYFQDENKQDNFSFSNKSKKSHYV